MKTSLTEDPLTEAADLVRFVRMADTGTAIQLARATLERFMLIGKREAIQEMRQEIGRKAS